VVRFSVTVDGASSSAPAVLQVRSDTGSALGVRDQRCSSAGKGQLTCSVTSAPSAFAFKGAAPHGGSVTFTVSRADGTADGDPSNNSTVVSLD
jgi:hypothetical protein